MAPKQGSRRLNNAGKGSIHSHINPEIDSELFRYVFDWKSFLQTVRGKDVPLLKNHQQFQQAIYVYGCPRSGTTITSRLIGQSEEIADLKNEFTTALILCGAIKHELVKRRYCLQTTYLHERYQELTQLNEDAKIVWLIRNPYSVIWSMLYHWPKYALNDLYDCCGKAQNSNHYDRDTSQLEKACFSYLGKNIQLQECLRKLGSKRVFILDYDQLILQKELSLSDLFRFLGVPYRQQYGQILNNTSLEKQFHLTSRERATINVLCLESYVRILKRHEMHDKAA